MNRFEIRAVYTEDTICVYQAFCREIAEEAVRDGKFGIRFKMDRMTWIKPSFLWMMYRCGWAEKEGQEHVLSIHMKRTAFDYAVRNAVRSSYSADTGVSEEEWKSQIKKSDIRCQWDPERDIHGNPLEYRSIQLGLRGRAVHDYVNNWIIGMEDITEYVRGLNERRKKGEDITHDLPQEMPYQIGQQQI